MENLLDLFSRFKSNCDTAYAPFDKKQKVIVDCDHEYEITGVTNHEYNLAIEDSQMIIKKIQGQTKVASEQLINIIDVAETTKNGITYSIKDSMFLIKGTSTINFTEFFILKTPITYKGDFSLNINNSVANTGDFFSLRDDASFVYAVDIDTANKFKNINYTGANNLTRVAFSFSKGRTYNVVYKPMLVSGKYTSETMPPFKPYNNNLVNSKANLISTSRNIFDGKWEKGSIDLDTGENTTPSNIDTIRTDFIKIIPNQVLSVSKTDSKNVKLRFYNENKEYISGRSFLTTSTTINELNVSYVRFTIDNENNLNYKLMFNYGDTALDYEEHQEVNYPIGIELGLADSIENGITTRATNKIVFDGSDDEVWFVSYENDNGIINFGYAFNSNKQPKKADDGNANNVINVNIPFTLEPQATATTAPAILTNISYFYLRMKKSEIPDVDALRVWLAANPIQFAYKTNTPTTEQIVLPAGYFVWAKGLQRQVIDGDYHPYIITKEYAISDSAQIMANAKMNITQQEQIDNNTNDIKTIKNDLYNELSVSVESTESSLITGETGSEYGLALKDTETPLVTRIEGDTRRYSEQLLNIADVEETTKEGITYSVKNGIIKLNGTASGTDVISITLPLKTELAIGTYSVKIEILNITDQLQNNIVFLTNKENKNNLSFTINKFHSSISSTTAKQYAQIYINQGATITNGEIRYIVVDSLFTEQTMPAFKPYDNTLVNAKADLLSTGKNIINLKDISGEGYNIYNNILTTQKGISQTLELKSPIKLIKGIPYTLSRGISYNANFILQNANTENIAYIGYGNSSTTFTLSQDEVITKCFVSSSDANNRVSKIMLNYGSTPLDYEPHQEDTFVFGLELGKYDYYDSLSNLHVKGQSDVITLDGSDDEGWYIDNSTDSENKRYACLISDRAPSNEFGSIINVSNWIDITAYETYSNNEGVSGIAVQGGAIFALNSEYINDLEGFKQWLSQNPIQVTYKLATPVVTNYNAPASFVSYKGGLQQQVTSDYGKYLPYSKIYKKYSLNTKSQLSSFIETNKDQQSQINENKKDIKNIENNVNYSTEDIAALFTEEKL